MKILAALLAFIILSGCISFPFGSIHREGFSKEDLTVPHSYTNTPEKVKKPASTMSSQPGYSYNISWELSKTYVGYGGVVKIHVNNTGDNDIFIYNFGIKIDMTEWRWGNNETGIIVNTGEAQRAYLTFGSQHIPGNYSYSFTMSFMVNNKAGSFPFHARNEWYDSGTSIVKKKNCYVNIRPYNSSSNYKYSNNYYYYFDKINELVDSLDLSVLNKLNEITSRYPGRYNIFQICAIFDYLRDELSYIEENEDIWSSPIDTLKKCGGDCEDYAILFSTLIASKKGTARVYLTDNHAFAAVYLGSKTNAADLLTEIETYYAPDLFFTVFEDEFGWWLVADPLSSFYLGGLPVGADVIGPSLENDLYNWGFVGTTKVNVIDVMRD
jgi:hypothetical protein